MNCTKLTQALLALSFTYLAGQSLEAKAQVSASPALGISMPAVQKAAQSNKKASSLGIKIDNNNVMLLNMSLVEHPEVIMRIKLSAKSVAKVQEAVHNEKAALSKKSKAEQTTFVTKKINAILAPVEQFFDAIQEYSGMVLPILETSLKNHHADNNAILIKYFSSKTHIKEYCTQEISSIDALEKFCKELSYFFADLNATFDENVKQAFKTFLKKLKKNRRNKK